MVPLKPFFRDSPNHWEEVLADPHEVADVIVRVWKTKGLTSVGGLPEYLKEKPEET